MVIDCVGSAESIAQSIAMVRPRGTVALVGMPGRVTLDLAPLWHREVRLAGAYAYGTETVPKVRAPRSSAARSASPAAATATATATSTCHRRFRRCQNWWREIQRRTGGGGDHVRPGLRGGGRPATGRLVSATYPLDRFEEAVAHAGAAGRRGAVKIAFDITKGHTR